MANEMNKWLGHMAGDDKRFIKNKNPEQYIEEMLL